MSDRRLTPLDDSSEGYPWSRERTDDRASNSAGKLCRVGAGRFEWPREMVVVLARPMSRSRGPNSAGDVKAGFASFGVNVDGGVLAYAGVSPQWVPIWSNWGTLLIRHRAITLTGGTLSLWVVYTGPTPAGAPLTTCSVEELRLEPGGRWLRVWLADRKLWVSEDHRTTLEQWQSTRSGN